MKTIAVVLSGCGYLDGAEIQESVLTLLALDKMGVKIVYAAPDIPQFHTVDHLTGAPVELDSRNVLLESARIARGDIIPLSKLEVKNVDAVIFPGGRAGKPLGVMCIAPALAAKATQNTEFKLTLTIGSDPGAAKAIEALGAKHINCPVDDIVFDEKHKVVSTPAYMLGPSIAYVAKGIDKLVQKIINLI